jgi:sugar lactone lactonase YvrE
MVDSASLKLVPQWLSCLFLRRLLAIAIINCAASGYLYSQSTLRARSQLLGSLSPFSFPERIVVGPEGELYILDTDLSTLFVLETRTGKLNRVCGPEKLSSPSDLAVDRKGNFWVLSAVRSKIFKLTQQCEVQTEITSKPLPLKVATNMFGEVIVLKGAGSYLFELYGPDGKLLREFGERIDYKDETTNSELSDGRIAPDSSGGFFFSFNYPPLIRHYGRRGNLISEFKPPSDINIAPPNVSVRKVGNSMVVKSTYQILVLDMAFDGNGRLYLLMSGKNKVPALSEGTGKLALFAPSGRLLKTADLENNFHAIAANGRSLYLLRNRRPLRVDTYSLF